MAWPSEGQQAVYSWARVLRQQLAQHGCTHCSAAAVADAEPRCLSAQAGQVARTTGAGHLLEAIKAR